MCAAYIKGIRISPYFAQFLHFMLFWANSSLSADMMKYRWTLVSSFQNQPLLSVAYRTLWPGDVWLWQICASAGETALMASAHVDCCSSTISSKVHQRQLFWASWRLFCVILQFDGHDGPIKDCSVAATKCCKALVVMSFIAITSQKTVMLTEQISLVQHKIQIIHFD